LSKSIQILTANAPEATYKFCKSCENCARDTPLWGVYIPKFGKISLKFSVLVIVDSLHDNFLSIGATYQPCGAKKLKIVL